MNNVFDFRRFGKYIGYDLRRIRSTYGLTFLIIALMPVVLLAITRIWCFVSVKPWSAPDLDARVGVFIITTIALVLSWAPSCYGFVTEKKAGSSWLTLPASTTEKFVSMILVSAVLMPVAYLALYLGSDALLCLMDKSFGISLMGDFFSSSSEVRIAGVRDTVVGHGTYYLYMSFLIPMLTYLLGALFFKKNKVVKTILSQIAFGFLLALLVGFAVGHWDVTGERVEAFMESVFGTDPEIALKRVKIAGNVVMWLFAALLGAGSFFRIKTLKH